MRQIAIDIVKKFMPYLYSNGNTIDQVENRRFNNAIKCSRILVANAKLICPYVSRKDKDSVAEFRSPDCQFVDFWIEIESELNNLTLEDVE